MVDIGTTLYTVLQNNTQDSDDVEITINGNIIYNYTSFSFENDFFIPHNVFNLVIEDVNSIRLLQITGFDGMIISGAPISFSINGKLQFFGWIYNAEISTSIHGGHVLNLTAQDILGIAKDSTLQPNLNFTVNSTYQSVIQSIFSSFGFINGSQFIFDNDSDNLQIISGKTKNVRPNIKPNTKKRRKKQNYNDKLNRQLKPYPNEGVMEFCNRFITRIGWFIKHFPNIDSTKNILCLLPPIYDREDDIYDGATLSRPPYSITSNKDKNTIFVLDGKLNINYEKQSSVLIYEGNFSGSGNTYRTDHNLVIVNEISGYNPNIYDNILSDSNNYSKFTNVVSSTITSWAPANSGSSIFDTNIPLYNLLNNIGLISEQSLTSPFSRPNFIYDSESATSDELSFKTRSDLYKLQNDFFTLNYTVAGLSANKAIYQPNTMINVQDLTLTKFGVNDKFWIKKIVMKRSRGSGTTTNLELKLPYIYDFVLTGGD